MLLLVLEMVLDLVFLCCHASRILTYERSSFMIRYNLIFATFFALTLTMSIQSSEARTVQKMDNHMETQAIPLLHLLAKMGKTYNCYFTVESAWTDSDSANLMESYLVSLPQDKKDIRSSLELLQQKVPNFTFIINSSNKRIFHVIDARLLKQEGYGLSRILKSVDFSGPVRELPDFIGKQGIPVGNVGMIDIRDARVQDFSTNLQVKGQNLQVRTLLSNYIPLGERGRIIWIARTKLGKGEISRVQFRKVKEQP